MRITSLRKVFPELMEKVHAFLWERVKSRDLCPLDENEQKTLQDCAVCANLYFDFYHHPKKHLLFGDGFQGLAWHIDPTGIGLMPSFWSLEKELMNFQNPENDPNFIVRLFSRISVAQDMFAIFENGVDPDLK